MENFSYKDLEVIHNCLLEKRIVLLSDISKEKNNINCDDEILEELEQEYKKISKVFTKISIKVNDVCELEKEKERNRIESEAENYLSIKKVFHDI